MSVNDEIRKYVDRLKAKQEGPHWLFARLFKDGKLEPAKKWEKKEPVND